MLDSCGGMESSDEKKKLSEDLVRFIRKRSETDAPRYTARLKTYVDIQHKRRRAAAARRHNELNDKILDARKKAEIEANDKSYDSNGRNDKSVLRSSQSRSESREPLDRCGRRRRRRRRGSCGRRRRRRRSCGRRKRKRRGCSRRRRRRKSCGRKRRRRSCGRRRSRRRRC